MCSHIQLDRLALTFCDNQIFLSRRLPKTFASYQKIDMKSNIQMRSDNRVLYVVSLILAFHQIHSLQKTSALRMCNHRDCQLQLMLAQVSYYNFYIPTPHLISNPYFVMCFRERTPKPSDSQFCTLQGLKNNFTCFDVTYPKDGSPIVMKNWTADSTLSSPNITTTSPYTQNITNSSSQVIIDIKPLLSTNKIYEVYVGYVVALMRDSKSKNAFFMTFQLPNQKSSDNLFMQRNVACSLFYYNQYYNYNLLFYGGVVRGGNDTLFVTVLSYLIDINGNFPEKVNLNVWIGISFSSTSHAGRDMIVFISDNYTTLDLYSLYYSAPYLDTSPNIKGTYDVVDIGDSNSYFQGNISYFYWSGASRPYNTGDVNGDELIMKKMSASISYSIGYNPSVTGAYSPLVVANKHNNTNSFSFNVAVWEGWLVLRLVGVVIGLVVLV